MPDIDTVSTPQSSGSSPYQGVSTPPPGPIMTQNEPGDTPTPNSAGPSPSAAQGANQPSQAQQAPQAPQQAPQGPQGAQQPPQAPKQPGKPQQAPGAAPAPAPTPQQQNPLASHIRSAAEILAGGPKTTYSIDANTGTMVKTQQPLSAGHIGMAIALEAISGSLTGLAQRGPGANARGAEMAFQQSAQQKIQQNEQQKQQASEDYARKVQIFETNMRMRNNDMQLAKSDADVKNSYVKPMHDMAEDIYSNHPEAVAGFVNYSDFSKYNVTEDNGIPWAVVPRYDKNGQQIKQNGVPQTDIQYMILKPNFSGTILTPEIKGLMQKYHMPGADNPLMGNSAMNAGIQLNLASQASALQLVDNDIKDFYSTVNRANAKPTYTGLNAPTFSNDDVESAINQATKKYGVDPAFIRGIIQKESGGNPDVKDGTSGEQGVMQILPSTGAQLGLKDPKDIYQNVDAGTKYFAQLMQKYADPMKALAAYNGQGPQAEAYAQDVAKSIGLGSQDAVASTKSPLDAPDISALTAKDPTLGPALAKFQSALTHTPPQATTGLTSWAKAIAAMPDKNAANKVTNLFGGTDKIDDYDQARELEYNQSKIDQSINETETKTREKLALNQKSADAMDDLIRGPENFDFAAHPELAKMGSKDLAAALASYGVKVPANFADLYGVGRAYTDDPNNFTPKVWRTGDPNVMSKTQAMSYIHNFINPDFNERQYANMSATEKRIANPDSQFNKTIQSVGTATNHMDLLRQAAHEVASGQPLNGQYPALNALAGQMQVQNGQSPYLTLQALTRRVNSEISNVAGGGFAPHANDVEETMKNMTAANSEQQIDDLIKTYTGLMHGRLSTQQSWLKAADNSDLKGVDPAVNTLFRKYGLDTPWDKTQQNQNGQSQNGQGLNRNQQGQPAPKVVPPGKFPAYKNGQIVGYADDQSGKNAVSF